MTLSLNADTAGPTTVPFARKDAFVGGYPGTAVGAASAGVWCFDLASKWSYPKQAAPITGDPIKDVFTGENGATPLGDGDFTFFGTDTAGFANSGFQIASHTAQGASGIRAPAAMSAAIYGNNTDAVKRWLVGVYVTLPTEAQWPTVVGSTPAIVSMADALGSEATEFALQMTVSSTNKFLQLARRVSATPTFETGLVRGSDNDIPYGKTILLAAYRTAAGSFLYLNSVARGEKIVQLTGNTEANGDYSSKRIKFGIAGNGQSVPANDLTHHRIHRGFVEALAVTGRDPLAVLRADFALQVKRGVYPLTA